MSLLATRCARINLVIWLQCDFDKLIIVTKNDLFPKNNPIWTLVECTVQDFIIPQGYRTITKL